MHSFSLEDTTRVIHFIDNYAEDNAIRLPGRTSNVKDFDKTQLLPSSTTKKRVYELYAQSLRGSIHRVAALTQFNAIWRQCRSFIYPVKPMSDLCHICQQNSAAITRTPIERQSEVK